MNIQEKKNIENKLKKVSNIILVAGCIGCIITFVSSCLIWDSNIFGWEVKGINWMGVPVFIQMLTVTVLSWGIIIGIYGILSSIKTEEEAK